MTQFFAEDYAPPPNIRYGFFGRNGDPRRALGAEELLTPRQEHGNKVARVVSAAFRPTADGVITSRPNLAVGVTTADCLPVLLIAANKGRATEVAAIHCGWRGLDKGALAAAVAAMGGEITALLGPSIAAPNYEVGAEFALKGLEDCLIRFGKKRRFDLRKAAVKLLKNEGVVDIFHCGLCTFADERLFSRRRSLKKGRPDYGRQISAVVLKP